MLSSTVALAAATANQFPEPFVKSGSADVAVVYGSNVKVAQTDIDSALNIARKLNNYVVTASVTPSTTPPAAPAGTEEAYKIETSASKLSLGSNLTDIKTTKVTKSDLPNMLAKKTYRSYDSQSYEYEQELTLYEGLSFTHFADNDYNNRNPTIGLHLTGNQPVLNYTITFTKAVESDVTTAGRLEDLENTKITLLGKEYTLLNAYNASSSTKFDLMAGASTETLNLNDEKTMVVNGKSYTVKMTYVDADSAKYDVTYDGKTERTTDLPKGGTFKLGDGTQIGVRDLSYQGIQGGIMSSEISLGAEKLTLENGQTVDLNDKDISGLTAYISRSTSGTKVTITGITVLWKVDKEEFVTPAQGVTFPGLNSLKLYMTNLTVPAVETTKVQNDGSVNIQIKTELKDGPVSFNILSGNGTQFNRIGKDGSGATKLITSAGATGLVFDSDTDLYMVATWNTSNSGESYLLDMRTSQDNSVNYTSIRGITTNGTAEKCKVQASQTCTIGNVVLTVNSIDYAANSVNVSGGTGVSFNRLVTSKGLWMWLPVNGSTVANTVNGELFLDSAAGSSNVTSYTIRFFEEDKYNNLKQVGFNVTVGGWSSDGKVQITGIQGAFLSDSGAVSSSNYFEIGDTDKYVAYMGTSLATKLFYDTAGSQDTAEIEYHGDEVYGNVYLAAPSVGITPVTPVTNVTNVTNVGIPYLTDAQVATQAPNKNLIVVGGSCINTVAATLLGSATPLCGEDFSKATQTKVGRAVGTGNYLVAAFDSPYNANKTAMLVAGWEAGDTVSAATYLTTQAENVSTKKGDVVVNGVKVTVSG